MNVQCAAGLFRNRPRQERCHHFVDNRYFANGAFEQKHLICKIDRISVQEIQFKLCRAHFLRQRIDLNVLRLTIGIDVVNERIEVIHRIDAVRLFRCFCPTQPSFRRLNFFIGIGMWIDQVELDLGSNDRSPAFCFEEVENFAQHITWRGIDGRAITMGTVQEY